MATSCPERGMGVLEVVVGRIQSLWCGGERGAMGKGCLAGWFERIHHRPPRKLLPPSTTSHLDWTCEVVKGRNKACWEGAHVFSGVHSRFSLRPPERNQETNWFPNWVPLEFKRSKKTVATKVKSRFFNKQLQLLLRGSGFCSL